MSSNTLQMYVQQLPSQYNIGCCTACASLVAAEIIMAIGNQKICLSRLFVYYMTREMQGRSGQEGAELKMTLTAMMKFGVSPEQHWPFNFTRVNTEPSIQSRNEAAYYRLHSFDFISPIHFKEAIDRKLPIVIGMYTGKLFWELRGPLEKQAYKPINSTDNRQSKGHAVTIVGYDDDINGGSYIIANSLGPKWGDRGYGAIPYSCISDIGESYVLNGFAGIPPGRKISEI